jgi:hypothetical protein
MTQLDGARGTNKIHAYSLCENFIREDHSEDLGVDERIILK